MIAAAGLLGGLSLALEQGNGGGLYWVAASVIGGLLWSIGSAWRFLVGVIDEQRVAPDGPT